MQGKIIKITDDQRYFYIEGGIICDVSTVGDLPLVPQTTVYYDLVAQKNGQLRGINVSLTPLPNVEVVKDGEIQMEKLEDFIIPELLVDNLVNKDLIIKDKTLKGKNLDFYISRLTQKVEFIDISGNKIQDSKLTLTQLNRFYYQFLGIYNLKIPIDQKKIKLLMFKANLNYAAKRNGIHRFACMISSLVDMTVITETDKDFNDHLLAFQLHFEALVAYYPKKKQG